jgi:hypothetical protein
MIACGKLVDSFNPLRYDGIYIRLLLFRVGRGTGPMKPGNRPNIGTVLTCREKRLFPLSSDNKRRAIRIGLSLIGVGFFHALKTKAEGSSTVDTILYIMFERQGEEK